MNFAVVELNWINNELASAEQRRHCCLFRAALQQNSVCIIDRHFPVFFFLSVSIEAGGRSWKTAAIISLSIISAILFAVVMLLLFKKTIKPYI